jgi:hypothetical protein
MSFEKDQEKERINMSTRFDMSWGDVTSNNSNGGPTANYLKLQNGENKMRVVSAPSKIELHWEETVDGAKKRIVCIGAKCPICKKGKSPQIRFQVKVLDRADGEVKVLECGKQIISSIKNYAVDPDYGDPTKYDIKIKKEGTGRDTKYSILPSPNKGDLTSEELAKVEEAPTIAEINKFRSVDDIYSMQLRCLADSIADLAEEDDTTITGDDPDWADL